jgi:hypothetical protein
VKRRRWRRRGRPSPRALVALAVAAVVVIAAAVLIARGDRTPRPAHAAVLHPGVTGVATVVLARGLVR